MKQYKNIAIVFSAFVLTCLLTFVFVSIKDKIDNNRRHNKLEKVFEEKIEEIEKINPEIENAKFNAEEKQKEIDSLTKLKEALPEHISKQEYDNIHNQLENESN